MYVLTLFLPYGNRFFAGNSRPAGCQQSGRAGAAARAHGEGDEAPYEDALRLGGAAQWGIDPGAAGSWELKS